MWLSSSFLHSCVPDIKKKKEKRKKEMNECPSGHMCRRRVTTHTKVADRRIYRNTQCNKNDDDVPWRMWTHNNTIKEKKRKTHTFRRLIHTRIYNNFYYYIVITYYSTIYPERYLVLTYLANGYTVQLSLYILLATNSEKSEEHDDDEVIFF